MRDGTCIALDAAGARDTDRRDSDAPEDVDGGCTPESELEFCQQHGVECGQFTAEDNCGTSRTVDCGQLEGIGCAELATCVLAEDSEQAETNECRCPDVDFDAEHTEICAEVGYDCGLFEPAERCGDWEEDVGVIDCGNCEGEIDCGMAAQNICGCPCEIDGGCYAEGQSAEDAPCKVCDPQQSETEFSAGEDGISCGENAVCQSGDCVCDGDFQSCGGGCIDPQTNDDHCGGCNNPCSDRQTCDGGQCVCTSDYSECGGACVDTSTNSGHCGGCDTACGDVEVCSSGECVEDCPSGQMVCGGACRNTDTDDQHCGGCNNDCTADDGWYDTGSSYACCESGDACDCQDQEYREHYCEGGDCSYDATDQRTVTSGCSTCDDGDSCTESTCSGGSCQNDAYCSGSNTSCGCTSCTDCTSADGWYDTGSAYGCCEGGDACTCQDQEHRAYSCNGTDCDYEVTDQRTVSSGCSTCDDGDSCTDSYCSGGSCQNDAYCSGSDTSCGCASCTNCDDDDGWYDDGSSYSCCDGGDACTCQDQNYRDYSCSGDSCDYDVSDQRTVSSGCTNCGTNETCSGGSCVCQETRSDSQVCSDEGADCGTVTDVCGDSVDCGGCGDDVCDDNTCVECLQASDCGSTSCGTWSDCSAPENECNGDRTRDCDQPVCDNGACTTDTYTETDTCCMDYTTSCTCEDDEGNIELGNCNSDSTCGCECSGM